MNTGRVLGMTALAALLLMPAYADIEPVVGSASGTFSNPTNGSTVSGNQWLYNGSTGFVTFNGAGFSGSTPHAFNFGSVTLTNKSSQPTGTFDATLNLEVDFTTPAGKSAVFADALAVTAQSGGGSSGHGDVLTFNGFPGPQTFSAGGETYTVAYDGFFDSSLNENTALTSVFVVNDPGGTSTAYLWGTITADPTTDSRVPEPSSVILLITVAGTCVVGIRNRARRSPRANT